MVSISPLRPLQTCCCSSCLCSRKKRVNPVQSVVAGCACVPESTGLRAKLLRVAEAAQRKHSSTNSTPRRLGKSSASCARPFSSAMTVSPESRCNTACAALSTDGGASEAVPGTFGGGRSEELQMGFTFFNYGRRLNSAEPCGQLRAKSFDRRENLGLHLGLCRLDAA
jgi:hypothetical protein